MRKVLIAGLGSIGQRHVRNLRTLYGDQVEILAYRVRGLSQVLTEAGTIEPGADVETKYNIHAYRDLDEALDQKPDVVFVTNPIAYHLPVALAAARRGCHLFIEKPLSHNEEGLDELIGLVKRQRTVALVAYQMRFHPAVSLVKSLLEQGVIGRLVSAHIDMGEYLPTMHPWEDYRKTHPARRDQGGGVLLAQSHEIDYAYWFFGLPRRLYALGGHLSSLVVNTEDTADFLMECEFAGHPLPVHVHMDHLQRPPERVCKIIGEEGRIELNILGYSLAIWHLPTNTREVHTWESYPRNQMYLDELQHFQRCLEGKEKPVVSLGDGRQTVRIALAARRSMESGQVVELLKEEGR